MSHILKEKVKSLKGIFKSWSKDTFGNLDFRVDQLNERIKDFDVLAGKRYLSTLEEVERT